MRGVRARSDRFPSFARSEEGGSRPARHRVVLAHDDAEGPIRDRRRPGTTRRSALSAPAADQRPSISWTTRRPPTAPRNPRRLAVAAGLDACPVTRRAKAPARSETEGLAGLDLADPLLARGDACDQGTRVVLCGGPRPSPGIRFSRATGTPALTSRSKGDRVHCSPARIITTPSGRRRAQEAVDRLDLRPRRAPRELRLEEVDPAPRGYGAGFPVEELLVPVLGIVQQNGYGSRHSASWCLFSRTSCAETAPIIAEAQRPERPRHLVASDPETGRAPWR